MMVVSVVSMSVNARRRIFRWASDLFAVNAGPARM